MNSFRLQGWVGSLLLHACALIALVLAPRLPSTSMKDSFTWEVQMVQPSLKSSAQPASATQSADSRPVPSVSAVTPPVRRAQPVVHQVNTMSSEQPSEIRHMQVVTTPLSHRLQTHPLPLQDRLQSTHSATPISSPDVPQDRMAAVARRDTAATELSAVVQQHSISEVVPVQSPQPLAKAEAEATTPFDSSGSVLADSHGVVEQRVVQASAKEQERSESHQSVEAVTVSSRAIGAGQPHYGWLKEDLRERIERAKYYPQAALDRRWEGRVLVRAIIWADGHLSDVSVIESSGYEALDREALSLLERLSPLSLRHPLGAPQITLRIPINYGMK